MSSAYAADTTVITETFIRIGHDAMPIMLKENTDNGCFYVGNASSKEIGEASITIEKKLCIVNGKPIEEDIQVLRIVKTKIEKSKVSGEIVNNIPKGHIVSI